MDVNKYVCVCEEEIERGRERKKSELSTMRGNFWMYPRDKYYSELYKIVIKLI